MMASGKKAGGVEADGHCGAECAENELVADGAGQPGNRENEG
jgi:hypothetical protein